MLAISVRFLTGRYHATAWGRYVNEGIPEWPPSPWRLLRALVSVWKSSFRHIDDARMYRILANLVAAAPEYRLPPTTVGITRHYMPPASSMVFDTFAVVGSRFTSIPPVTFIWPHTTLSEADKEILHQMLLALPYLGRAESWCEAYVDKSEGIVSNCRPVRPGQPCLRGEPVRVLVPDPADIETLLSDLIIETKTMRQKQKQIYPHGAHWVLYDRPKEMAHGFAGEPRPLTKPEPFLLARYAIDASLLPHITRTVQIATLSRRALMALDGRMNGKEVSPVFSGKSRNGEPLIGHRHAFYLPIDEDRDNHIDHIWVYSPGGFSARELSAIGMLSKLKEPGGTEFRVVLTGLLSCADLQEPPPPLRDLVGPSKTWVSATPFVLGRHPKRKSNGEPKLTADGRWIDGPQDQILGSWREVVPCSATVDLVSIENVPYLRSNSSKRIRWLDFQRWRPNRKPALNRAYGFRLEFSYEIRGPLSLGYGAHFGLGQFLPEK